MGDFSFIDEKGNLCDGPKEDLNVFLFVQALLSGRENIFCEKGVAPVVLDGGIGMDKAEGDYLRGAESGFFKEFSLGRLLGTIALFHKAARDLQCDVPGAVAVLPDQNDLILRREGDDVHPW